MNLQANKRKTILWASAALLLVIAAAAAIWVATRPVAPISAGPGKELTSLSKGLDSISITARFDPEKALMQVEQTLLLTNRGEDSRPDLVLRTYPNVFQSPETSPGATEELYDGCYPDGFSAGSLVIESASLQIGTSQEAPVLHQYTDDAKTALRIPVSQGWLAGQQITVALRYTVHIPNAAHRFGVRNGIWALGNAFAIPSVWENGTWRTDPYQSIGDPFISECRNYTVTVTTPAGYTCAGSSYPTVREENGMLTHRFDAPGVRDFALSISNRYEMEWQQHGDVLVTAASVQPGRANTLLQFAIKALESFSARYGAYPYASYTVAEVDFPFGGMEYPSMVMISSDQISRGGMDLELLVAHETAHQWWYAVVGSDQINQAWQDEALCEYSLLAYAEDEYGHGMREDLRQSRIETAMRVTIPRGVTPGSPVDSFASLAEYTLVVYRRGAAMLCALDTAMNGGLDDFLKTYYDRYRFAIASRKDFEQLLRETTGEDWSPLMTDYLDTHIQN